MYTDSHYLAAMQCVGKLRNHHIRKLLAHTNNAKDAWLALQDSSLLEQVAQVKADNIPEIKSEATDSLLEKLAAQLQYHAISVIHDIDALYPSYLHSIFDPPITLFCKGNINCLHNLCIAMVGSRRCTAYGKNVAIQFAKVLGEHGVTVVSGGARGIDSYSHEGALAGKGPTVAVLGCGVDKIYPKENKGLFERILANDGLLLSEYPPGTEPEAYHFPMRNRIIGGISKAVVVVEAKGSSGSLITADMAINNGRDVYAVPGNVLEAHAAGNHWLLRQGAQVLTKPDDILEDYNWNDHTKNSRIRTGSVLHCTTEEDGILQALHTDVPSSVEDILQRTNMPLSTIQVHLLQLELKKYIYKDSSGKYIVIINRSDMVVD